MDVAIPVQHRQPIADILQRNALAISVGILQKYIHNAIEIQVAPPDDDMHFATDLFIRARGCERVAVRYRTYKSTTLDRYVRDFTIRSRTTLNARTEIHKVREGYAKWYVYGWEDEYSNFAEWVFVDMDKVRASGLLDEDRYYIPNGDGTYFFAYKLSELDTHHAILERHILPKPQTQLVAA